MLTENPILMTVPEAATSPHSPCGNTGVRVNSLPDELTPLVSSLLNASTDTIMLIGADQRVSFINTAGRATIRAGDCAVIGGHHWSQVWPADSQPRMRQAIQEALSGCASVFETQSNLNHSGSRCWSVSVSPVNGESGQAAGVLVVSRDINDRVNTADGATNRNGGNHRNEVAPASEENRDLNWARTAERRETDHRVKNSLAMISGLLRRQARSAGHDEARDALLKAAARIHVVSQIHQSLCQSDDIGETSLSDYLSPLCTEVCNAMGGASVLLHLDLASVNCAPNHAVTVGLISSELLLNALRHAVGEDGGNIWVRFEAKEGEDWRMTIEDDGRGLPEGFDAASGDGLGMQLIRLYANSLGGTYQFTARDGGGTVFTLVYPKP